jgi:hypothetical protein
MPGGFHLMKIKSIFLLIALASLFFLCGWKMQAARVQWEYKESCSYKDLNKLGDDGWELVSATSSSSITCYYFKRAK